MIQVESNQQGSYS